MKTNAPRIPSGGTAPPLKPELELNQRYENSSADPSQVTLERRPPTLGWITANPSGKTADGFSPERARSLIYIGIGLMSKANSGISARETKRRISSARVFSTAN